MVSKLVKVVGSGRVDMQSWISKRKLFSGWLERMVHVCGSNWLRFFVRWLLSDSGQVIVQLFTFKNSSSSAISQKEKLYEKWIWIVWFKVRKQIRWIFHNTRKKVFPHVTSGQNRSSYRQYTKWVSLFTFLSVDWFVITLHLSDPNVHNKSKLDSSNNCKKLQKCHKTITTAQLISTATTIRTQQINSFTQYSFRW